MQPKLTVIMSNYNQAALLPTAVESFLKQKTNFPVRLIITDDCSTKDNSVEIINDYVKKYPDKITALLNDENGRYLKNILRAKSITKSEYFCLLDSDDYWTDENYLQDAVDFLDANPDFVIYSRNVTCLTESGQTYPFIPDSCPNQDFDLNNYFNDNIVISQTTGTVFRNVIFANGVPSIMSDAIGTISERSFEGDFDRYLMHLKYGRAHFVNKSSGVYRILSSGIWCRLSDFDKCAIQAQCFLDYNEYFDRKYNNFFISRAYTEWCKCVKILRDSKAPINITPDGQQIFFAVFNACMQNIDLITPAKRPKKLRHRIMLKIYNKLNRKLSGRGLVS